VGLGDGIEEGELEGIGVVGNKDGLGEGSAVGTTGIKVGLGDGIAEGDDVGFVVVGNAVGLGVGTVDGIGLGDGEGIKEGLGDGSNVVGNFVGNIVGDGVGAHVSQYKSIHSSCVVPLLDKYISHKLSSRGGVFVHSTLNSYNAIIPVSL